LPALHSKQESAQAWSKPKEGPELCLLRLRGVVGPLHMAPGRASLSRSMVGAVAKSCASWAFLHSRVYGRALLTVPHAAVRAPAVRACALVAVPRVEHRMVNASRIIDPALHAAIHSEEGWSSNETVDSDPGIFAR